MIAVDDTKVQADASRNENLDYEPIAREIIQEAIDTDRLYGDARGDEVPEQLRTGEGRRRGCERPRSARKSSATRTRSRCRVAGPSG